MRPKIGRPTKISYHIPVAFVNRDVSILHNFCILSKIFLFTLYNIPYCILLKGMLSYSHKRWYQCTRKTSPRFQNFISLQSQNRNSFHFKFRQIVEDFLILTPPSPSEYMRSDQTCFQCKLQGNVVWNPHICKINSAPASPSHSCFWEIHFR